MKLSVAANYDLDLVPELANHPVDEVYGKLPHDGLGGGRPRYMASPLTPRRLADYVAALRSRGIAFNYLLNASCLGNKEWGRKWQRRLARLLDMLKSMGIERLTVSTPYLLRRVKATHPQFMVKAGIYAQIDTPRRARFWHDLGADCLTLESFSINRDFSRLEAIRKAVPGELVLVANHPCLLNCPLQPYHQNMFAHGSADGDGFFIDYCFLNCTRRRIEEPAEIIRSAWIRPEDLHRYERIGFTTFKLLERGIPSEDLLKRVRAYSERSFSGNLLELLLPYGFRRPPRKERFWMLRNFLRPGRVSPLKLLPLYRLIRQQGMMFAPAGESGPRLENQRLGLQFIDHFIEGRCTGHCQSCGYCQSVAQATIACDDSWRISSLARFQQVEQMITSGSLWQ